MKLLKKYRVSSSPERKKPADPRVRRRRGGVPVEPDVLYINKSVYDMVSSRNTSPEDLIEKINFKHNLKLSGDIDELLAEISKRGWKVSSVDLENGRNHKARFFRGVGENKSRTFTKIAPTLKSLFLLVLEQVLTEENARFDNRVNQLKRKNPSKENE
jgi:hypothetical protein